MQIERYRPEYQPDFERLNRAWLESFGLLESHDVAVLADPARHFVQPGGEVFLALLDGRVVGTVAIVPEGNGRFELAKLAVDPAARGRGIGRALAAEAIAFAQRRAAHTIELSSNSALREAIALYRSLGFVHVPVPDDVKYETADVYMSLTL